MRAVQSCKIERGMLLPVGVDILGMDANEVYFFDCGKERVPHRYRLISKSLPMFRGVVAAFKDDRGSLWGLEVWPGK